MITAEPPKVVAGALYNATGRKLYEGRELTRFWYSRV